MSNEEKCPICGNPRVQSCRCSGPHSLEDLKKGHGLQCKNGHRWSRGEAYDPATEKQAGKNHKDFDNKKDALAFLSDHALMSVGWPEGGQQMVAIYWNGKLNISRADEKKKWAKTAGLANVDENTLRVGRIKTVQDAQRICKEKWDALPRLGYQFKIDEGTFGDEPRKYRTYLANFEVGGFRVLTWVDSPPTLASGKGLKLTLSKSLWAEAGLKKGWIKEAAARKCVRCGHPMQNHPDQVGHKDILQCPRCFLDYSPYAESGQSADFDPQTGEIRTGPTEKIFPSSEWPSQRK